MTALHALRTKLVRELARCEHAAKDHTVRAARRFCDLPPGRALRAVSAHAEAQRPRFAHLLGRDPRLGFAGALGSLVAAVRRAIVDRLVDAEHAYRDMLLELRRGLDVARLLRDVAVHDGDLALARFCDELLVERGLLIEDLEQALAWFAGEPARALRPGRRALAPVVR